jgi:transcriptional regulator with XRE-family HTH domain
MRRRGDALATHLGNVAREARVKQGWTQADVAERIGLTPEVYGRLERGLMRPSVPTLVRLRHVLGVTSDELLGLSPERVAQKTIREAPEPLAETPEIRRLMRTVRGLKPKALTLIRELAAHLLKRNVSKARIQAGESQRSS